MYKITIKDLELIENALIEALHDHNQDSTYDICNKALLIVQDKYLDIKPKYIKSVKSDRKM